MKTSSLLTLFITVIVVVIAAEFFVNDYSLSPADGETNVVDANGEVRHDWASDFEDLQDETDGDVPEGEVAPMALNFDAAADFGDAPSTVPEDSSTGVDAQITFGLIGLSGFQNVTLQRVPFNGILFERIDLRDFNSVPVVLQNLLQDNKTRVAGFYEFHSDSELLAGEIYLLIREKAAAGLEVNVNETNDFGDKSFYINYADRPDAAFLVVKIKESVYALTYEKGLHPFMSSLMRYLNT